MWEEEESEREKRIVNEFQIPEETLSHTDPLDLSHKIVALALQSELRLEQHLKTTRRHLNLNLSKSLKHYYYYYNMGSQKEDSSSCSQSDENKSPHDNTTTTTSTVGIPQHIIFFDILSRLPATFLLSNARFVSKSWLRMLCNSQFAEAHLLHAKPGLFIQSKKQHSHALFLDIKDNGEFEVCYLNRPYPGRILNSCSGLSLFMKYATGALYVVNPFTMQSAGVPNLPGAKLRKPLCALTRDPHTGEFKLFAAHVQKQSSVRLNHWYVLRFGIDDSWRKIGTESSDFDFKCAPIYTGVYDLYWITKHRVIAMDVGKETFRAFQLPHVQQRRLSQYLKMGDYLSCILFLRIGFQIHIFDSQSGEWTFYHQIEYIVYPIRHNGHYFQVIRPECFCVWVNHEQEVFIKLLTDRFRTMLFGYNVNTRNVRVIDVIDMFSWDSYELELHVNSLVSWKSALA